MNLATADLFHAEIARLHAEIDRLRLTEKEREAIAWVCGDVADITGPTEDTLRGLLERTKPDRPEAIATGDNDMPQPIAAPAECTVPPEWRSRSYWVDPPSGWQYGFPRLYDPASDGNLTEWLIREGYPEKMARQGLLCTFTARTDNVEK